MMKADERALLQAVCDAGIVAGKPHARFPRDIVAEIAIAPKRASYLFEKWAGRGWYDYGVTVDLGWLYEDKLPEIREALGID